MHRTTNLCVLAMIALALGGCEDVPVGFMELELADGTMTRVHIDRMTASRLVPPAGAADEPGRVQVLLEGWDEEQTSYGLLVTLEPRGTWAADDVRYCDGPIHRAPMCARFAVDAAGDGYADHLVQRDADGETVHAWARFADDGAGPRGARATFHFDQSAVVRVQQFDDDAP